MTNAEYQKQNIIWFLMVFLVIIGIGAGSQYDDMVNEQKIYCENIENDVHPDYELSYDKWCK